MTEGKSAENKSKQLAHINDIISREHGISRLAQMTGGEIGVPLFRGINADGEVKVIKIGFGGKNQEGEVANNIFGYQEIIKAGGEDILPSGLKFVSVESVSAIIMDHLGESFAEKTKQGETGIHQTLIKGVAELTNKTTVGDPLLHQKGVDVFKASLRKWYSTLSSSNLVTEETVDKIDSISSPQLSGSQSALMLLDFTPDNVFVNDKVSFIDPWKQDAYLGTPIPSWGQFTTLAEDIYHLPDSDRLTADLQALSYSVGYNLGLDDSQIESQYLMGKALQYSLSAYVRRSSSPQMAQIFAQRGADIITSIR